MSMHKVNLNFLKAYAFIKKVKVSKQNWTADESESKKVFLTDFGY